ncbi:MAG: DUF4340 domain-containing protein [Treponema sp.]|jgi:hypothetical protein|nr:DUF4340 domain-containing protein [Treponema sp.]
MEYKKRLIYILSLIGALALVYLASFIFDPEFAGTRSASYVWLDSKLAGRTARIVVGAQDGGVELVKKSGQWFVLHNGTEYPARQLRIEDFTGIFTSRKAWPVRSSSASSHEKLGVGENSAKRITLYGENSVLLDILLGNEDVTGREIYLRKYGQNEVRSGENLFASYITGSANGWYNLRLIPESEDGKVAVDSVQRLSVYSPQGTQVFSRKNRTWTVSGIEVANPDPANIDGYVKAVLNLEGDDFSDSIARDDPKFNYASLVLELGDGGVKTVRVTDADETDRRFARVEGSDYVYSLAPWAAQKLFRSAQDFEKQ